MSRAKADELRKGGRFDEAAQEYAAIWPDGDKWTGWGYAFCLRKLGRSQDALRVAEELHSIDHTFPMGRSILSWALYDVHARGVDPAEERMRKAAREIVRLTRSDDQRFARTSPFVPTVLRMAKYWAKQGRSNNTLKWLGTLEPARLSSEPFTRKDESGRPREIASPRERYYAGLTRALNQLGRWEECLQASTQALNDCGQLHHGNEVWFRRRIAISKLELGRADEALRELEELATRKPSGFLETDVARSAWALGDHDRTFKHALQALLSPEDIGFKLEAARLLAEVLWRRGEKEAARAHIRLCLTVRSKERWKIPETLKKTATEWEVDQGQVDPNALLGELRPLWEKWREQLAPRRRGTVFRLLPHGKAGFIRAEDGERLFFKARDWQERPSKPAEGIAVTFATRPGFDPKRQVATTEAYDVKPVTQ